MATQLEESGTFFLFPPHHRLFAVFDDPVAGARVTEELRARGDGDDVWTFFGEKGIRSLDAHVLHHGVPVGVVRFVQRLLTSDCEYCDGLGAALRAGAMVIAVRVGQERVDEVSQQLRQQGGHSLAYGQHLDFVPVQGAGHAVGFFSPVRHESPGEA